MYNIFSERRDFDPHSNKGLLPGEHTPEQEEKEPLPVIEEVTTHITDGFPLGASVSLSVSLASPLEVPPSPKPSQPDHLDSPMAPHITTPLL